MPSDPDKNLACRGTPKVSTSEAMVQRRRDWRSRTIVWAARQRGRRYVWGETDCASMVRGFLDQVYGVELFPLLPPLRSLAEAVVVAQAVDVPGLFTRAGLSVVPPRESYRWPMGTILADRDDRDFYFFAVYCDPFVVHSAPEMGVQWCDPTSYPRTPQWAWGLSPIAHIVHG